MIYLLNQKEHIKECLKTVLNKVKMNHIKSKNAGKNSKLK